MLVLDALDLPGAEYCRGYIQAWLAGDTIPEANAQRIIKAADRILSRKLQRSSEKSPPRKRDRLTHPLTHS